MWGHAPVLRSCILSLFGRNGHPLAHSVASSALDGPAPDARRHVRIDTSISAALHFDEENAPVVIGNISPAGAMLKTPTLPSEGDLVHIVRGGLCTEGKVIWCSVDRCGVEFSREIDVSEWLAPAAHAGQARVDEIVAILKAGTCSAELVEGGTNGGAPKSSTLEDDLGLLRALLKNLKDDLVLSSETLDLHSDKLPYLDRAMERLSDPKILKRSTYQLVDELGGVLQLLVELEDELAHTKDTVARHGYKLQHLDLAMQMLTELGSELITGSRDSLSTSPRLQNLRSVCSNALKTPSKKPS